MKIAVLLFLLFGLSVAFSYGSPRILFGKGKTMKQKIEEALKKWDGYKTKFGKEYSAAEEKEHMEIFVKNVIKIEEHNLEHLFGKTSFKMEINHFTDMPSHKIAKMNGFRRPLPTATGAAEEHNFLAPMNVKLPTLIDWRQHGLVTDVKDQGHCGSCWAFSAVGALEGQHARKTGKLVSLSEQNLVDCSFGYNNNGCDGGLMDNAFSYVKDNHGIDTERSYPYVGEMSDFKCHFNNKTIGADDIGFFDLPHNDEGQLLIALATQGPISVAIDATQKLMSYSEGIFYDEDCSSTELNHGVLLVGYGTDFKDGDYWLVKNSWSSNWGENGYVRMARNRQNHCGIASFASYPIV